MKRFKFTFSYKPKIDEDKSIEVIKYIHDNYDNIHHDGIMDIIYGLNDLIVFKNGVSEIMVDAEYMPEIAQQISGLIRKYAPESLSVSEDKHDFSAIMKIIDKFKSNFVNIRKISETLTVENLEYLASVGVLIKEDIDNTGDFFIHADSKAIPIIKDGIDEIIIKTTGDDSATTQMNLVRLARMIFRDGKFSANSGYTRGFCDTVARTVLISKGKIKVAMLKDTSSYKYY